MAGFNKRLQPQAYSLFEAFGLISRSYDNRVLATQS